MAEGSVASGATWDVGFVGPGSCPYTFGLELSVSAGGETWRSGLYAADPTASMEAHRTRPHLDGVGAVAVFGYVGPAVVTVGSSAPHELVVTEPVDGYRLFVQWLPDLEGALTLRGLDDDGDVVVNAAFEPGEADAEVEVLGDATVGGDNGPAVTPIVIAAAVVSGLVVAALLFTRRQRHDRRREFESRLRQDEEARMFGHLSKPETETEYHHHGNMGTQWF